MRISKRISQSSAAKICGVSEQAIGHYENGRMDISEARLDQLLRAYGYARADLNAYLAGKPIPFVSIKDECVVLPRFTPS